MSILATHDSLTAYPVKSWWFRPFNFLCKCQDKTLREQYDAGARSFDLRFAKWCGEWYAAHGAMIYDIRLWEVMGLLIDLSYDNSEPVYFRVLCEDTFYRESDTEELAKAIDRSLVRFHSRYLRPLYVRSKRTWETAKEYRANAKCADYNVCWDKPFTFKGMEKAKSELYHLITSNDKINFIGCYSSKFIPRIAARILTNFAKKMTWKDNDCPVVDFL
jgi:hypothetical protein